MSGGRSGATVTRRGGVYRKTSGDPRHDLPGEGARLGRLRAHGIPAALAADVDLDDLDDERTGWTRDQLVARLLETRPADEDLAVCHGDLCLPNVLLDPETYEVTGLIDAGRLGVADRWADLALATRSMAYELNPPYDAGRFLARYGIEPDPAKTAFYRLLDEFF